MQSSELSVKNLQTKIEAAFSGIEPPLPENIARYNEYPEGRAIRRVFRGENWRTIPAKKLEWGFDKLPLLTPDAFHYFLPAFMLYSLQKPEGEVCLFVLYALAYNKNEDKYWWQESLDKFTNNQKTACNWFLRWLLLNPEYRDYDEDADAIKHALKTWWKTETS
jgi:hypothetical protein